MNDHFGIGAFFIVLIIVIQSIIGSYFSFKNFKYFHQTGVAILLGILVSAITYYGLDYQVKLEKKIFVYVFLPAIVFSEGYSLKKKIFFNNMTYILIYGFLGTIITFTFLAFSMNYIQNNGLISIESNRKHSNEADYVPTEVFLGTKEIILFSAALSSKDSFLGSTMVDHHAYPTLFHIVFGEGIMNDATSLVVFESFEQLIEHESKMSWSTIPYVFGLFFVSIILSVLSGTFFGVICTLILKHMKFLNETVIHEILIVFMCSYSSYCIIEYFQYSGIISLLVSGFIVGYYGFHNLSDKAKICANVTFQTISSGAENFLFAFVGFTTFSFYQNAWSYSLIGWIILILIISRVFQVFVVSAIFRLFYRKTPFIVKLREQTVLCFTGVSRGILGYILMDQVHSDDFQDLLNSTMIGVLIITTLFFGIINPKVIECVLPAPQHHNVEHQKDAHAHEKKTKLETELGSSKLHDLKQDHDLKNYKVEQQMACQQLEKVDNNIISLENVELENQDKKDQKGQENTKSEKQKQKSKDEIKNNNNPSNSKAEIQQDPQMTQKFNNLFHYDESQFDPEYFFVKKQKIQALLNNKYDPELFASKIRFKISRINEKYIKPFLIRDYKSKLDEFIIASRFLREDRMQLIRPQHQNRNSAFIAASLIRVKNVLKNIHHQKKQEKEQKPQVPDEENKKFVSQKNNSISQNKID
ncbi:transporter/monovalent cation:proton antiporter-1 (CPA1) family protein (macronuclear) [Tetrahymena thermophila SB210]|uniref:Transporter/monovalent cation:proton antiporter-1 (CPA1) family protein n=1 Tax=Tetrahymena thermophila (strain SB210) TaxID=312017 RepID=Q24DC4_TETTS|nr:transporter/monovalent cation:proton antiporter-1 (CPA1) family protein [Tetrahymena thermophila SB210]EAS05781.2 transporter/monovalent cation:proton antiporter-1 (CPA1) family protein [Tetrahymena thermophila SB210]|eukprot:XP_001026026.2 transporter/monovalent cation:proton antiporter-1 (CPA1) family protein [Tetrahymena thermophila SB210]